MRTRFIAAAAAVLAIGIGVRAAAQGGPGSVSQTYEIPPGAQAFLLETPGPSPLYDLRFVLGGSQAVEISRIQGTLGSPDYAFATGTTPHDVTRFFMQNPISASESTSFTVYVSNGGSEPVRLTAHALWDDAP